MEPPMLLQRKIVGFLVQLPNIHNLVNQEWLVYSAGLDGKLRNQIQFGIPAMQFSQLLVSLLVSYGRLDDGRDALEAILVASKECIGQDKRKYCDILIHRLRKHARSTSILERKPGNIIALFDGLLRSPLWRLKLNFALIKKLFLTIKGLVGNVSGASQGETDMDTDNKLNVLEFNDIPDETFLKKLDFTELSLVKVFGHTGENIIRELLALFERCDDDLQRVLKQIDTRILLRDPQSSTGRRSKGIAHTIDNIRKFQRQEFNKLRVHFYQDLPTFRGFVCYRKNSNDRIAAISFYHFPPNKASKRFPQTVYIDERKSGKNEMIDIFESWFEHFWGKTKDNEIHTIIFDFDDTIADSHDIQIEAWGDTIREAQKKYDLKQENFCTKIWEHLSDKEQLREDVQKIFFKCQHADSIFDNIFCNVPESTKNELHQRRFELREGKMKTVRLFPQSSDVLKKLASEYHLVIISATDEVMIRQCLEREKFKEDQSNLSAYFLHIFGKREPIFDWKNVERKSQLILKVVSDLGVPMERIVYIGDNNSDFDACKRIGIDFIEARLFGQLVHSVTGQESLIDSDDQPEFFTIWDDLPNVLKKVEEKKRGDAK